MGNVNACKTDCCDDSGDKGNETLVKANPSSFAGLDTAPSAGKTQSRDESRDEFQQDTLAQPEKNEETVVSIPEEPFPVTRVERYEDGSAYEGQVVHCERHGQGTWRSDQESYEGEWAHDHRHGNGKQLWHDGRAFHGQFQAGKFHGNGRMEWKTPQGLTTFEGQYVQDQKHGVGRFSWPDGRMYEGQWVDGKRHGSATFTNPKGATRQGIWKDDALVRWLAADEVAPTAAT